MDDEKKSMKEVQKVVKTMNIQVDNLCQFLPQDRVQQFSMMTPVEVLKETEYAIFGDDMVTKHNRLVELSKVLLNLFSYRSYIAGFGYFVLCMSLPTLRRLAHCHWRSLFGTYTTEQCELCQRAGDCEYFDTEGARKKSETSGR